MNLDKVFTLNILGIARSWFSVDDSRTDNSVNHCNLFLDVLERNNAITLCCLDIANIVGNVTSGVVDLLNNIEALVGNGFGNGGQSSRNVLVHNGEANGVGRSGIQLSVGEVDTVDNGTVLKVVSDGVSGHGSSGVFGFFGGGTQVRKNKCVLVVPKEILREISDVFTVTGVQEFLHGFRIDKFSTSKVQKDGVRAEVGDDVLSDDSVGSTFSFHVWDIDGNVVGSSDGTGDGVDEVHVTRQSHGGLNTKTWIVTLDLHSQGLGIASSHGSNVTESNDGQSLSGNFLSTEHGLVLFDTFSLQSLLSKTLHVVDSVDNSARSQKHTAQDQLLDGIGIGSRGVEDRDTQFGHARDRNVVGTGSASEQN